MSTTSIPDDFDALEKQVNELIASSRDESGVTPESRLEGTKQAVYSCIFRYARKNHSFSGQVQELAERMSEPTTELYLSKVPDFVHISATSDRTSKFIYLDGVSVLVDGKYITDEVEAAIKRINDSLASNRAKPASIKPIVIAANDTIH